MAIIWGKISKYLEYLYGLIPNWKMGQIEIRSEEEIGRYHKILVNNGIEKEIKEVITVEPDLGGEHLSSVCDYVTIKFADGSQDLDLFVKTFFNKPGFEELSKEMAIFNKEAEFFNSTLPDAKEFCMNKTGNDSLINYFPKSYYGDDKIIVLENLLKRDYYMLNKFERQDLQQAEMVILKLAKFHGVFHAMMNEIGVEAFSKKYPFVFREAFINPKMGDILSPWCENGISTCIKIVEANDLQNGKEALEWLYSQLGKVFVTLIDLVKGGPEEHLLVVNHGDCWNNNIMFRKNEDGIITDNLLIDMQMMRYGSPNLDLSYFLFTSVRPEIRRQHWKSLLQTYFDTLSETTSILGSSINISFDEFVDNFRKKSLMGILLALAFFSTIDAIKHNDMDERPEDDQAWDPFTNSINKWVKDNPEIAKVISKDTIEVIAEYKKLNGE